MLLVIICLFSNTRESSREFLTAANSQGMSVNEFAYILPWLQDGAKDVSPWIGSDGAILQKVKDQYANSIIFIAFNFTHAHHKNTYNTKTESFQIDDVNSFDNSIITPFLDRIKVAGLTEADVDLANIYGYLYLFDALKLYALTAKKVMNETGEARNLVNGRLMWNAMRRMKYEGMKNSKGSHRPKNV
ncbi:unnamed protein product, partial [Cylicostephanus goldi]